MSRRWGVVLGHVDRQQPMHDYCLGLLMPIERKSVEPMAALTAPAQRCYGASGEDKASSSLDTTDGDAPCRSRTT